MKKFLAAAIIGGALLVIPSTASADFMDKYNAADEVERRISDKYGLDPYVSCHPISRRSFTCSISDYKGSCSYSGRAGVYKRSYYTYSVMSMRLSKSCF